MAGCFPFAFSLHSSVVTENGCRSHRLMSNTYALLVCSSMCEHWCEAFKNALLIVSRSTNWTCFGRTLSLFSDRKAVLLFGKRIVSLQLFLVMSSKKYLFHYPVVNVKMLLIILRNRQQPATFHIINEAAHFNVL